MGKFEFISIDKDSNFTRYHFNAEGLYLAVVNLISLVMCPSTEMDDDTIWVVRYETDDSTFEDLLSWNELMEMACDNDL